MAMLLLAALCLAVVCVFGWWQQRRTLNAGHADVIWALGVGACAVCYLALGEGSLLARVLIATLIASWSIRLGGHIWRRVHGAPEDGRYRAMREHFGVNANLFLLFFFLGQGLLAWLFSLPHWFLAVNAAVISVGWLVAGLTLGVLALWGESVADRQLARFRSKPENAGKTCRDGWWRYSRHPNYFFEWLHWFSYPLMATGISGAGWLWLAPIMMFLFLWFVTGIPYTERQALKSRGDDYREYQRTTSPFIPWRLKA